MARDPGPIEHRPFLDLDRLERVLIEAARIGRPVTYGQVLGYFGKRLGSGTVALLCRDLGAICARNRARREPELAALVVRKADGLPGEGFFTSERRRGRYDGPGTGPEAEAYVRALQARAFAHFANRRRAHPAALTPEAGSSSILGRPGKRQRGDAP